MKKLSDMKRLVILDEANALFREKGFEKPSVGEINARAGGSKTTIYGYFRSKEEIRAAGVYRRNVSGSAIPGSVSGLGHALTRMMLPVLMRPKPPSSRRKGMVGILGNCEKKMTLVLNLSAKHRQRFRCDSPTAEGMYLHLRVVPGGCPY